MSSKPFGFIVNTIKPDLADKSVYDLLVRLECLLMHFAIKTMIKQMI